MIIPATDRERTDSKAHADPRSWKELVRPYQHHDLGKALGQIATSFLPYFGLWVLMILSLEISYFLTLFLSVFAAGFLVRAFIITHDAGHGSFFASKRANTVIGVIGGLLTFLPYHYWTHRHAIHHATAGNLDKRGIGDVWTLTLQEYQKSSRWERFTFRFIRNPFVMFVIGPPYMFLIFHRFVHKGASRREALSVLFTNLGVLGIVLGMTALVGFKAYALVQLPVITIAGAAGIWLFYVQHQFEDIYWAKQEDWDYEKAAFEGSSFYELPRVLQWFSGNIGFHHIHHLSPRIPNYRLESCHRENLLFQKVKPLRLRESLKCARLRLWDEETHRMVPMGRAFF